jgi:hypothetical protein
VAGAAWWTAMRIVVEVEDLVQRTGDGRTGRVVERSRGQVTLCAVCTVHVEMRSVGFLIEPQNQGRWFVSGLSSKPLERFVLKTTEAVFYGLTSKPVVTVFSGLALKLVATVSPDLISKLVVGFLVELQSQCGGGFTSLGLKIGSYDLMIWVSK